MPAFAVLTKINPTDRVWATMIIHQPSNGEFYYQVYKRRNELGYQFSRTRYCYSPTKLTEIPWGTLIYRATTSSGATESLYEASDYFVAVHGSTKGTIDSFQVFCAGVEYVDQLTEQFSSQLAPNTPKDNDTTGYSFWYATREGPKHKDKMINTQRWESVTRNYSGGLQDDISKLVELQPKMDKGRLILWHGPPGTGKTSAIRALSREWRSWCDFLYITDPEQFFNDPQYFFHCVLSDNVTSWRYTNSRENNRWRIIIAEDSGEFLRRGAGQRERQAASRLLNASDGLLGQGLRFLIIITTNEPIGELDEAVCRPGRCLTNLNFGKFSPTAASKWLGRPVSSQMTLAELYQAQNNMMLSNVPEQDRPVGQYL